MRILPSSYVKKSIFKSIFKWQKIYICYSMLQYIFIEKYVLPMCFLGHFFYLHIFKYIFKKYEYNFQKHSKIYFALHILYFNPENTFTCQIRFFPLVYNMCEVCTWSVIVGYSKIWNVFSCPWNTFWNIFWYIKVEYLFIYCVIWAQLRTPLLL